REPANISCAARQVPGRRQGVSLKAPLIVGKRGSIPRECGHEGSSDSRRPAQGDLRKGCLSGPGGRGLARRQRYNETSARPNLLCIGKSWVTFAYGQHRGQVIRGNSTGVTSGNVPA